LKASQLVQIAGARLSRRRTATSSRDKPNLISSFRFGSSCARRAPKGATQLETGATRTAWPGSSANDGRRGRSGERPDRPACAANQSFRHATRDALLEHQHRGCEHPDSTVLGELWRVVPVNPLCSCSVAISGAAIRVGALAANRYWPVAGRGPDQPAQWLPRSRLADTGRHGRGAYPEAAQEPAPARRRGAATFPASWNHVVWRRRR